MELLPSTLELLKSLEGTKSKTGGGKWFRFLTFLTVLAIFANVFIIFSGKVFLTVSQPLSTSRFSDSEFFASIQDFGC